MLTSKDIAFTESRNLSPRRSVFERTKACHTLLLLLQSPEPPFSALDLIAADVVPALLHAAQLPVRTTANMVPNDAGPETELGDAALLLLAHMANEALAHLQAFGWVVDDDGSGRGRAVFIHPGEGRSQQEPPEEVVRAIAAGRSVGDEGESSSPGSGGGGEEWAARLMLELSVLTSPLADDGEHGDGESSGVERALVWPARVRFHDVEELGPPARLAVTVVDVVQDDDEDDEDDDDDEDGHAVPTSATTRHLVLGPWHGVSSFRETEVDLTVPPGTHLESWYTCAMAIVTVLATRKPGRGKILLLGLGGGALPSFLNRYFPAMQVEAVECELHVAAVAERWFGLKCEPPMATGEWNAPRQHDEPEEFISAAAPAADGDVIDDDEGAMSSSTRVRIALAERFVTAAAMDPECRFDVILVDVYSRGSFPPALLTRQFFSDVATLLKPADEVDGSSTSTDRWHGGSVIVNAGDGTDRREVERIMRDIFPSEGVRLLHDVNAGRAEGDYENVVIVGSRSKMFRISQEEWDKRVDAVAQMWPKAPPQPFRLKSAMEGNDGDIIIGLGQGRIFEVQEEERRRTEAAERQGRDVESSFSRVGEVELAPRDDPAFELFD